MLKATFRSAGLAAIVLSWAAAPALADEDVSPSKRRTAGMVAQRTYMAPVPYMAPAPVVPFVVPPCSEDFDALVLRCAPVPRVAVQNDPALAGLLRTIRGDYNGPYPAIVPDP